MSDDTETNFWMIQSRDDVRHQVETYDAKQVHCRKNNLCLRCGRPERVNRYHCEQCHEETME